METKTLFGINMEIHYKDLTIGEKYGIISKNSQLTYDIIGICMSYNKIFSTFEIINRSKKYSAKYKTIFYMNSSFRYFLLNQKQKIQDAMEERALQKIVQQIIGDQYFKLI